MIADDIPQEYQSMPSMALQNSSRACEAAPREQKY
jgi:hypothetical protein